jgi:hypothetical protein
MENKEAWPTPICPPVTWANSPVNGRRLADCHRTALEDWHSFWTTYAVSESSLHLTANTALLHYKTIWLMLFREIFGVYFENKTIRVWIHRLWQTAEILIVTFHKFWNNPPVFTLRSFGFFLNFLIFVLIIHFQIYPLMSVEHTVLHNLEPSVHEYIKLCKTVYVP